MARPVLWLARACAATGGLVLLALVILVVVSVTGRGLGTIGHGGGPDWLTAFGPVDGDFELVEAGIAFAIFSFLPLAQVTGAHATVDVFTSALPERAQAWLRAFWEVMLAGAILLIARQLWLGLLGKHRSGQTTFILQFPVWWAYAAAFAAAAVAALVAVWCADARLREALTGRRRLPPGGGGDP